MKKIILFVILLDTGISCWSPAGEMDATADEMEVTQDPAVLLAVKEDDGAQGTINERVRRYLEKKRQGNGVEKCSIPNESTYNAIKNDKERAMRIPNLNGRDSMAPCHTGSFLNKDDNRISLAFLRHHFEGSLNVSFSFDPVTLTCHNCGGGPHPILGGSDVFVLSDQCFPPALPTTSAKCINIVRVENGSLMELAETFISVMVGGAVPVGSLVILSSGSHLGQVGLAGYTEDMVRAAKYIMDRLNHKVLVRVGFPLLLSGTDSAGLIRAITEMGGWVPVLRDNRENFLCSYASEILVCLKNLGKNGQQQCYDTKIRLPVSLSSFEKKVFNSGGWEDLPNGAHPMDSATEGSLINTFITEINTKFSKNLDPTPSLNRAAKECVTSAQGGISNAKRSFIVVGASHAARLAEALRQQGHTVAVVSTPSWRPTATWIETAAKELTGLCANASPDTLILFQFLDCAAYYAKTEEGDLLPSRRVVGTNNYHLDGDLVVAPAETFLASLKTSLPLLRAGVGKQKVLLSPLPRYWAKGCCDDEEHIRNRCEPTYEDDIFEGLDRLRRQCKNFAHMNKIGSCNVVSTAQLMCGHLGSRSTPSETRSTLKAKWGQDAVHGADCCYTDLAANIVKFREEKESEVEDSTASTAGIQRGIKRPRWLCEDEAEVVRPTPGGSGPNYERGWRGGWRGRRGRGGPRRW
jgi:hypothetical protein